MESVEPLGKEVPEALPPPPPLPPNIIPNRLPMARKGTGNSGQRIQLLTNHFKVGFNAGDGSFFQYSVAIKSEDSRDVDGKGIGRRVLDRLQQAYASELANRDFAYDGENTLFTVGPLPQNNFEFTVVLEEASSNRAGRNGGPGNESPGEGDRKRMRRPYQTKTFKVLISFATKIPLRLINSALQGNHSENYQEAIRVLDVILRQHSAKRGCLLVRQSFFHSDPRNYTDLGGGVTGCRGFHSSFRATQAGLALNMDVTTTMILKPGPVIDFLVANQNARHPGEIDWGKAKRMLKNMRVKTRHTNMEFKITGLSERNCNEQQFPLRIRNANGQTGDEAETVNITVYEYFVQHRGMELTFSDRLPCINVGRPKRPNYLPIELCELVSLQRYTKALTSQQRSTLVEKSRQKPHERKGVLTDALNNNRYGEDPMLRACGISINSQFISVEGRVLPPPKLRFGNGEDTPQRGRWNFNNKQLFKPIKIERWAVVNFSARCDGRHVAQELAKCGRYKGVEIEPPFAVFDENHQDRHSGPIGRVDKMFEQMMMGPRKLPGPPQFILCILPERKNSDIYGPWKKKNLADHGIVTQCIAPGKLNDQYFTNVLLKINSKLGGINSLLTVEHSPSIPLICQVPTLILGLDVSHGSPGQSDVPSIAAVVSSREWPYVSRYRASVRTQSPKVEMIDSLFKPVEGAKKDNGIIRELLHDFYISSGNRKPEHIIIFRDGVSESQFTQVLNKELDQIIKACRYLDEDWDPKFTLIVAQKNHNTKFFQEKSSDNVPPGTVVDTRICHPRNYDFYMCAHAGLIGTSRPTHYHVLLDQIGFTADDLQRLVHALSYVYQRSTTAISVETGLESASSYGTGKITDLVSNSVAPICYAHLAAAQMSQFIKFGDMSDGSSSHGGVSSVGDIHVPELPRLHDNVCRSMFFC